MAQFKEKASACNKTKDCTGTIYRRVFPDNWFVEHCNKCNFWNAGFLKEVQ